MPIVVNAKRSPIKVTGTTATASDVIPNGQQIYINWIYWLGPATAADVLSVKDENGDDIAQFVCEVDAQSQLLPIFNNFTGVKIDDMDSGTVYIYHN